MKTKTKYKANFDPPGIEQIEVYLTQDGFHYTEDGRVLATKAKGFKIVDTFTQAVVFLKTHFTAKEKKLASELNRVRDIIKHLPNEN